MRVNRDGLIISIVLAALTVGGCAPPTASSDAAAQAQVSPDGVPEFVAEVAPVTDAELGASWRPGCPVDPEDLRRLTLRHWGFDDRPHLGTIIVHETVVAEVRTAFATLYRERFPIRRMVPVDHYDGDDDRSMADDNTSGFNCRAAVADGPTRWSAHAYGRAIDINPVENPYLLGDRVLPPTGTAYADRGDHRPGMAVPGSVPVAAFEAVGWSWGGAWGSPDYQHFHRTDEKA
jgi:hypothetical protein